MSEPFSKILAEGEEIKWFSKPNLFVFMLSNIPLVIIGIIMLIFVNGFSDITSGAFGSFDVSKNITINDVEYSMDGDNYLRDGEPISKEAYEETVDSVSKMFDFSKYFLIPFYLIGGLMVISPITSLLRYSKEHYAFTQNRVLIANGFIGQDFKTIDFKNIKNSSVNVNLLDKMFSTGTISIFSGELVYNNNSTANGADRLIGIKNPYETFKLFKELSSK